MKPRILLLTLFIALVAPADEIHDAARSGDLELTKSLLKQGANVNAIGLYGQTPIFFAADRGHIEIVKLLIASGAQLNLKDSFYNMTPLMRAAMKKRYDVISLMLEKGADGAGELLAQAALSDNADMAKAVIASGKSTAADLSAALGIAQNAQKPAMVEWLRAAGAKPPPPANFAADPAILATYVGEYMGGRGGTEFVARVSVDQGKLKVQLNNSEARLGAVSNTEFRDDQRQLTYVFQSDASGAVTGFTLKPWNQVYTRKK